MNIDVLYEKDELTTDGRKIYEYYDDEDNGILKSVILIPVGVYVPSPPCLGEFHNEVFEEFNFCPHCGTKLSYGENT